MEERTPPTERLTAEFPDAQGISAAGFGPPLRRSGNIWTKSGEIATPGAVS
jgi:hypothetical protein